MRGCRQLANAFLKSSLRDPVAFFFLIVFSPGLMIVLGLIFGNSPVQEFGGQGFVDQMLPGVAVLAIMIVGIMQVPQNQLMLRSTGVLTRLRMTPLKPRTFIAADLIVNASLGMVGAVLTVLLGVAVFHVTWPGDVAMVVLAFALGMVAMLAIGYMLAALYPSVAAATGIGNALMILLMLTSGAFVPMTSLSDGVRAVMCCSPVYHLAELVRASWAGDPWPWVSVVVLVGCAMGFGALGSVLFRWDRAK